MPWKNNLLLFGSKVNTMPCKHQILEIFIPLMNFRNRLVQTHPFSKSIRGPSCRLRPRRALPRNIENA